MRKIIRATPIAVALLVIAAVVAYRQQPGHHAPLAAAGLIVFVAAYTAVYAGVHLLTHDKGRQRRRRSGPYGY